MKLSNFNSIHTISSLIIISILLNSFILTNQTKIKTNTKQLVSNVNIIKTNKTINNKHDITYINNNDFLLLLLLLLLFLLLIHQTLDGLENPNDLLIPDSLDTSSEEDNELGFLQKGTKNKIKKEVSFNPYSGSGFIDPSVMRVNRKDNEIYRFKQNVNPDDEFENVNLTVSE